MRKLFYLFSILFTSVNMSSCVQDEMFEHESDEQLELASQGYSCSGGGKCLPKVSVSGEQNYATISLTYERKAEDQGNNDHKFTLRIWDAGFTYKEESNLPATALLFYRFPPSPTYATYSVSYSITCEECFGCFDGGFVQISSSGKINSGSPLSCFKNYVNYTVRLSGTGSSSVSVGTNSNLQYTDPEHYMGVNRMRVCNITNGGRSTVLDTQLGESYQYKITLPTPFSTSYTKYRVELYNDTQCRGNREHFVFFDYEYYVGTVHLGQYSLIGYKGNGHTGYE